MQKSYLENFRRRFSEMSVVGIFVVVLLWIYYRRLSNPEMTETRLFLTFWYEWAGIAAVLWGVYYFFKFKARAEKRAQEKNDRTITLTAVSPNMSELGNIFTIHKNIEELRRVVNDRKINPRSKWKVNYK